MSGFHESIRTLIAEVEKFLVETLKNEKLGKSSKNHKQDIIDRICKLKEEWPALSTVTEPTVKPAKDRFGTFSRWRRRSRIFSWIDIVKDDESTRTGGSSNTDDAEDPYADSSADIPNVSAMELTDFTKAGFLEKKRPGIGLRSMQKRWCVIKGNIFYYFTDKTSKKMNGAFRLTDYSFDEAPEMTKDEKKKELCFKLVRPANRTYEFMCLNKNDVEEWKNSVKQATSVSTFINKDIEEDDNDGDIYEPVGETELPDPSDLYDDGAEGDIYEEEPMAPVQSPEPEQDDIYDEGISTDTHDDGGSVSLPPPTPPIKPGQRSPLPPVPDEDPYKGQGRPLPPKRALPKEPEPPPENFASKEIEKVPDEPKSYRNEEDFENMYIGIWDCDGDNEKELSFKKGDIIYIINRDFDDKYWWIGELNGKFGLVPKNYLTEAYETLTF